MLLLNEYYFLSKIIVLMYGSGICVYTLCYGRIRRLE